MRVTLVIDIFEEYSKCPECGTDITKFEVEDDKCQLWCDCGWDIEITEKVKCDYCGENVETVRKTPVVADMGQGYKMCKICWDNERETIKGTYGRDIGGFKKGDDEQNGMGQRRTSKLFKRAC